MSGKRTEPDANSSEPDTNSAEKPPKTKKKSFKFKPLKAVKDQDPSKCNTGWEEPWRIVATEFVGTGNEIDQCDKEGKLLPLGDLDTARGCQAWRKAGCKDGSGGESKYILTTFALLTKNFCVQLSIGKGWPTTWPQRKSTHDPSCPIGMERSLRMTASKR